jgi:hypothetical protein
MGGDFEFVLMLSFTLRAPSHWKKMPLLDWFTEPVDKSGVKITATWKMYTGNSVLQQKNFNITPKIAYPRDFSAIS